MGGRQIRPARVYQTVTEELNHRILASSPSNPPPWYDVMTSVPPAETLVRTLSPHRGGHRLGNKGKNLFRPKEIIYIEDRLRRTFYKDHPWELARPRVIVEADGKDYQRCNWGQGLRQPGIPLTGESVVQRQLHLMREAKMPQKQAYDQVRKEFYRYRQEEEIEKRVAVEEARYVGAYFGKTRIDVGHYLEDREFENWKIWAGKETEKQEALRNSEIESFGLEEEDPEVEQNADPTAAKQEGETTTA